MTEVPEPPKEILCKDLEDSVWDRVNDSLADPLLLHIWDHAMVLNVDHVFNRVFNCVEEEGSHDG